MNWICEEGTALRDDQGTDSKTRKGMVATFVVGCIFQGHFMIFVKHREHDSFLPLVTVCQVLHAVHHVVLTYSELLKSILRMSNPSIKLIHIESSGLVYQCIH